MDSLLDCLDLLLTQRSRRVKIDFDPAERIVDQLIERSADGFEPTKPGLVVQHQQEAKRKVRDSTVEDAPQTLTSGLSVDDR